MTYNPRNYCLRYTQIFKQKASSMVLLKRAYPLCLTYFICLLLISPPVVSRTIYFSPHDLNSSQRSKITKNPDEKQLSDLDIYKFYIEHGGCGDDGKFSDCENDRQRVELIEKSKISLKSFNGKTKIVKKFYRTNLLIPAEDKFPNTFPMKQMVHQVKLHGKNQPVWMVHIKDSGLDVEIESRHSCKIDEKFVPRNEWIEIEIFADYTVSEKSKPRDDPYFVYWINGSKVCSFYVPLLTNRAIRDGSSKQELKLRFGIYNTFASKWLLGQNTNVQWIENNQITFSAYQQDSKGQSNGAVSSQLGTPFMYDWPVKLPKQTLYFSEWRIGNSRADLGESRFELIEKKLPKLTPELRMICTNALGAWTRFKTNNKWITKAENRGLTEQICIDLIRR